MNLKTAYETQLKSLEVVEKFPGLRALCFYTEHVECRQTTDGGIQVNSWEKTPIGFKH